MKTIRRKMFIYGHQAVVDHTGRLKGFVTGNKAQRLDKAEALGYKIYGKIIKGKVNAVD